MTRGLAYQAYINEVTCNGNTRMDNIILCNVGDRSDQHIATQVDMAFQAGWSAQAAEIARLCADLDAMKAERDAANAQLADGSFYKESDIDALQERADKAEAERDAARSEVAQLKGGLWAIGHAAGCETKRDLMLAARAMIEQEDKT